MDVDPIHGHEVPSPRSEFYGRFVRFEFTKFVDTDLVGRERDSAPKRGYLVFNDRLQEFGEHTFSSSDSYTLEYDVWEYVQRNHPEFVPYVKDTGGIYIDGNWWSLQLENPSI